MYLVILGWLLQANIHSTTASNLTEGAAPLTYFIKMRKEPMGKTGGILMKPAA
jgi:hypothetical protein